MKFRFSSGIALTFGKCEYALKLHPLLGFAGTQSVAFYYPLLRSAI